MRHALDVLRLCLTDQPRKGVLGYASSGLDGNVRYSARWRALPRAIADVWRPRVAALELVNEWVLSRQADGWALWRHPREAGPPTYFTVSVHADDQNAAFEWADQVTPDLDGKTIHYAGPPPA